MSSVSPQIKTNASTEATLWRETKTAEGRIYWYNTSTRQSTWKKPDTLWTEEEKLINACPWKEYTTAEGKKYYSHKESKQTTWEIPEAYQELLTSLKRIKETTASPVSSPAGVPTAVPNSNTAAAAMASPVRGPSPAAPLPAMSTPPVVPSPTRAIPSPASYSSGYTSTTATSASILLSQPPDIQVDSPEKAMEQFHQLLKSKGVTSDWNWEETMRAIITDPRYRVFKTTGERKHAFQQYLVMEASRKREEKENQERKEREDFFALLEATPQVKHYSSYRTVMPLLADSPAFRQVSSDRQRQDLFHDYIYQLRRKQKDELRKARKASMEQFKSLLNELSTKAKEEERENDNSDDHILLWKDVYEQHVLNREDKFEGMTDLDFLDVFQDYHRESWEKPLDAYRQRIEEQQHHDRLARDGFKELLKSLQQEGKIHAHTEWKDIYALVAHDERYLNLLGVPSSTPLDLFWDIIDDLDQVLYDQRRKVQDFLKQNNEKVTLETSLEEYQALLNQYPTLLSQIDDINVPLIYTEIQKKETRKQQEMERKLQKRIKTLRHVIRRLDNPPLQEQDTWDVIEPRLKQHPAYMDLDQHEEGRIEAFQQALSKLKAKHQQEQQQEANGEDDDEDDEEQDEDEEEGIIRE